MLRLIKLEYIIDFQNIVGYDTLNSILAQILLLVIGVELVVMLSLHIPSAFIEALMFAIARKMLLLPKENGMIDVLLGVIAMAILFGIRRYLIQKGTFITESEEKESKLNDEAMNIINEKYGEEYKSNSESSNVNNDTKTSKNIDLIEDEDDIHLFSN
ncbi:MAG: hypothetical protein LBR30_00855 [Clostridioides sp.]|jgi:hypothetical protein|nr:hypothetical protein [Clostridioides sp.]